MTLYVDTFPTPVGDFSVAIDRHGSVVATAFGDLARLRRRLDFCHLLSDKSAGLPRRGSAPVALAQPIDRTPDGARPSDPVCHLIGDKRHTGDVRMQVGEYFAGERRGFTIPLAQSGTPFQRLVWSALGRIPFGETRSYGQVAAALGVPSAARAVGRANATNPICLIVPCHRVVGADGSLTGFAFGEDIKRALIEHERRFAEEVQGRSAA